MGLWETLPLWIQLLLIGISLYALYRICTTTSADGIMVVEFPEQRIAVAYTQGMRPEMEDNYVVCKFRQHTFVAVMDGHGGSKCAEWLRTNLVYEMERQIKQFEEGYESKEACAEDLVEKSHRHKILSKAIKELDLDWLSDAKRDDSGSTLAMAWYTPRPDGKIIVTTANVGDSRIILCESSGGKRMSVALTSDHKPNLVSENERKDIVKRGGQLIRDATYVEFNGHGLAMTRAMGDAAMKSVITAVPDIGSYVLGQDVHSPQYLIFGTDGLWDRVPTEECLVSPYSNLKIVASEFVRRALSRRSLDNITVIVFQVA